MSTRAVQATVYDCDLYERCDVSALVTGSVAPGGWCSLTARGLRWHFCSSAHLVEFARSMSVEVREHGGTTLSALGHHLDRAIAEPPEGQP